MLKRRRAGRPEQLLLPVEVEEGLPRPKREWPLLTLRWKCGHLSGHPLDRDSGWNEQVRGHARDSLCWECLGEAPEGIRGGLEEERRWLIYLAATFEELRTSTWFRERLVRVIQACGTHEA